MSTRRAPGQANIEEHLLAGWWGRKWSLEEVRGFLGHSTVKVTERYARILDESVAQAALETRGELAFPAVSFSNRGLSPTIEFTCAVCGATASRNRKYKTGSTCSRKCAGVKAGQASGVARRGRAA